MNKPLIALLLITSFSASADKIPSSIQNLIAVYDTRTHSLEDGELTVRYNKRLLLVDAAESMFQGICNDYYMNKWKPGTIKRITLLNVTSDQGFEINGGGDECRKAGTMKDEQARTYRTSFIKPLQ
ncbi:hypothetical protein GUQ20_003924 [Salmonella enterica]|uniref:Uncharacterized protein n=3 Tax=Salmonella enterica TaxID=28901 RepID=A0A607PI21_SALET|nr:hypothetical protein [Salmonella enterica]EAW2160755.1 hypothetical protein [Salmonella enterica subsp. enterica]EBW0185040.1 hypothetical protein [Salmonella enterica subsp. enterica serovar Senftenberg]ECG1378975.1 hypothetical protein [Salmonella enterica subsp. enterica serovar Panama str. CFSAN000602]EDC7950229.1 hypothetical protein [Salmonella enterica subsp. enterica serovar Enteritidis]EDD4495306.1 hypothetical protein [Salmonella enterica subsp. enterica serovar Newport]EDE173523